MALIEIRGFNLHIQLHMGVNHLKKNQLSCKSRQPCILFTSSRVQPGRHFRLLFLLLTLFHCAHLFFFSVSFSMWDKGTHTCNILIS